MSKKHRNLYKESKNNKIFVSEYLYYNILTHSCNVLILLPNNYIENNPEKNNTNLDIFFCHSEMPISTTINAIKKIHIDEIETILKERQSSFPNKIDEQIYLINKEDKKSLEDRMYTMVEFSINKVQKENSKIDHAKELEVNFKEKPDSNTKKWVGGFENKPDWDTLFMAEAFLMAQKSIDPSTVHGSIWVSKDNKILSKGYNGPIRGSNDKEIPLSRPEKYFHFLHSEENCILNYNGSVSDTEDSIMYITGRPCHRCLRMIIQKGIKTVIYGPVGSACVDEEDMKAQELMLKNRNISIKQFNKIEDVKNLLYKTISYIDHKTH